MIEWTSMRKISVKTRVWDTWVKRKWLDRAILTILWSLPIAKDSNVSWMSWVFWRMIEYTDDIFPATLPETFSAISARKKRAQRSASWFIKIYQNSSPLISCSITLAASVTLACISVNVKLCSLLPSCGLNSIVFSSNVIKSIWLRKSGLSSNGMFCMSLPRMWSPLV